MSFTGSVIDGTIVLDDAPLLPDGTLVDVAIREKSEPTLLSLLCIAGTAKDLPADFAAEHNHYIHGTARRSPESTP